MGSNPPNFRRETVGKIPYAIVEGYPKFSVDNEREATATEQYIIPADRFRDFVAESYPPPWARQGKIIKPPRRIMPTDAGEDKRLFLTKSVTAEPWDGTLPGDPLGADKNAPAGTYDDVYRVTIEYSTGRDEDGDGKDDEESTFLEHTVNTGGEFLNFSPRKTKKAEVSPGEQPPLTVLGPAVQHHPDDGLPGQPGPLHENPNQVGSQQVIKTFPTIEHSLRWSYCLIPPWPLIVYNMGRVNFLPVFRFFPTFPAERETVLFLGVSAHQKFIWDGASARVQPWDIEFRFSQRRIAELIKTGGGQIVEAIYGWNHVWDPDLQNWVKVYRGSGDEKRPLYEYTTGNFEEMFQTIFLVEEP
jgi:hypothetical protein